VTLVCGGVMDDECGEADDVTCDYDEADGSWFQRHDGAYQKIQNE